MIIKILHACHEIKFAILHFYLSPNYCRFCLLYKINAKFTSIAGY